MAGQGVGPQMRPCPQTPQFLTIICQSAVPQSSYCLSDTTRNSRSAVSPFPGPSLAHSRALRGQMAARSAAIAISRPIPSIPALCDFRFAFTMGKPCREGTIPPLRLSKKRSGTGRLTANSSLSGPQGPGTFVEQSAVMALKWPQETLRPFLLRPPLPAQALPRPFFANSLRNCSFPFRAY